MMIHISQCKEPIRQLVNLKSKEKILINHRSSITQIRMKSVTMAFQILNTLVLNYSLKRNLKIRNGLF